MTSDDRFEELLAALLHDAAPSSGPDRLVPEIIRAARRERRWPRWFALMKEPPMRLSSRVAVGSPTFRLVSLLAITMALILAAGVAVVAGASLIPSPAPPACAEVVCPTGPLASGRAGHSATPLADGSVLVIGGESHFGQRLQFGAERWDPSSGTFEPAGTLGAARHSHTATLLPDGHILVVGGYGSFANGTDSLASAEVWDPGTREFTPTGSLSQPRAGQGAALLPDGRVLIIGGWAGGATPTSVTTEIWDPKTGQFGPGPSMGEPRGGLSAVTLEDGRVLVVGGNKGAPASAEVLDPTTMSFSPAGSLPQPGDFTLAQLSDGHVLAVGGPGAQSVTTAHLWDPATGLWTPTGSPLEPYSFYQTETALDDGRALLTSGTAEIWDPQTGAFSAIDTASVGLGQPSATLLTGGRVLVVGGLDSTGTAATTATIWDLHGFVPPAPSDAPSGTSPMP